MKILTKAVYYILFNADITTNIFFFVFPEFRYLVFTGLVLLTNVNKRQKSKHLPARESDNDYFSIIINRVDTTCGNDFFLFK